MYLQHRMLLSVPPRMEQDYI
eukprot:SAG31_NODE_44423_length_263_cov_0.554878_1_plen_20_part_10